MTERKNQKDQFSSDENYVKNVLKEFDFVKIYKGWIPNRFNEIKERLSHSHISNDFKYGFLDQMRIDDIVGKEINDILSTVSCAFSNAKEYKAMPLNILVAHFMNGDIESKTYMLTLLLLYEQNTRYVATVLFDFLMNSDNSSSTVHEIYCNIKFHVCNSWRSFIPY